MRSHPDTNSPTDSILLRAICIAVIVMGCAISLFGPATYGEDQDRHLVKTLLLLRGDMSYLVSGLETAGGWSTLSGLYFFIMAPAMALSGRPEWLYTYTDFLILLGAIPMWWLVRSLATAPVAWVAAALYIASSGRIENSWLGIHSSLAIPFCIAWHLCLIRFIQQRTWRLGLALVALILALLSLHVSYAPMIAAGVLLILWSRAHHSRTLSRFVTGRPMLMLLVTGLALGAAVVVASGLAWGRTGVRWAVLNQVAAIGEHVGFNTPFLRGEEWHYWAPGSRAMYLPVPVLLLGLYALWARRGKAGLQPERVPMARAWVLITSVVQLTAAWIVVVEWHWTVANMWRFRMITALVPVFVVVTALGLATLGDWGARVLRHRVTAATITGLAVLVLAGTQMGLLAFGYRGRPWRAGGASVVPELQETLTRTRTRWNYGKDWFRTSVFVEPTGSRELAEPRWEYLVEWLFGSPVNAGVTEPLADKVLYLVKPGSWLENRLLATQEIVDTVTTEYYNAYLCRRTARHLLPAEPFFLTYGHRGGPDHYLNPPPGALATRDLAVDGHHYALIASNVELPEQMALGLLSEVVVEKEGPDLVIGVRIYGRDLMQRGVWKRLKGPHVTVRANDGSDVRLDLLRDDVPVGRHLSVVRTLEGWATKQLESVEVGIDP